jgi:hypothetical protein
MMHYVSNEVGIKEYLAEFIKEEANAREPKGNSYKRPR